MEKLIKHENGQWSFAEEKLVKEKKEFNLEDAVTGHTKKFGPNVPESHKILPGNLRANIDHVFTDKELEQLENMSRDEKYRGKETKDKFKDPSKTKDELRDKFLNLAIKLQSNNHKKYPRGQHIPLDELIRVSEEPKKKKEKKEIKDKEEKDKIPKQEPTHIRNSEDIEKYLNMDPKELPEDLRHFRPHKTVHSGSLGLTNELERELYARNRDYISHSENFDKKPSTAQRNLSEEQRQKEIEKNATQAYSGRIKAQKEKIKNETKTPFKVDHEALAHQKAEYAGNETAAAKAREKLHSRYIKTAMDKINRTKFNDEKERYKAVKDAEAAAAEFSGYKKPNELFQSPEHNDNIRDQAIQLTRNMQNHIKDVALNGDNAKPLRYGNGVSWDNHLEHVLKDTSEEGESKEADRIKGLNLEDDNLKNIKDEDLVYPTIRHQYLTGKIHPNYPTGGRYTEEDLAGNTTMFGAKVGDPKFGKREVPTQVMWHYDPKNKKWINAGIKNYENGALPRARIINDSEAEGIPTDHILKELEKHGEHPMLQHIKKGIDLVPQLIDKAKKSHLENKISDTPLDISHEDVDGFSKAVQDIIKADNYRVYNQNKQGSPSNSGDKHWGKAKPLQTLIAENLGDGNPDSIPVKAMTNLWQSFNERNPMELEYHKYGIYNDDLTPKKNKHGTESKRLDPDTSIPLERNSDGLVVRKSEARPGKNFNKKSRSTNAVRDVNTLIQLKKDETGSLVPHKFKNLYLDLANHGSKHPFSASEGLSGKTFSNSYTADNNVSSIDDDLESQIPNANRNNRMARIGNNLKNEWRRNQNWAMQREAAQEQLANKKI